MTNKWKWVIAAVAAVIALLVTVWIAARNPSPPKDVFSPEHSSVAQAVSHFFGYRPEPRQPIAFVHQVHVESAELGCMDCHITVERGPQASIPDIRTCWGCHETTLTDHPEIKKLKEYHDKGQDIPWQRVWGWVEEAHVRFNHAPHIRASIDCATCHGDVSRMSVATRTFGHTMGFCVSCHQERKAPDDCVTCHY